MAAFQSLNDAYRNLSCHFTDLLITSHVVLQGLGHFSSACSWICVHKQATQTGCSAPPFLKCGHRIGECGRIGQQPRSVCSFKPPPDLSDTKGLHLNQHVLTFRWTWFQFQPLFSRQRRRRRARGEAASVNSSAERRTGAFSGASCSFTAIETSAGPNQRNSPVTTTISCLVESNLLRAHRRVERRRLEKRSGMEISHFHTELWRRCRCFLRMMKKDGFSAHTACWSLHASLRLFKRNK